MELRHLRYFVAVAEELSFTRASQRLHIAQPALSVQIRQLEDELGVQLFDRSRRTVRLTEAGTTMLTECRQLLAALDQAVELVRRTGVGHVGRLRLGFIPSAANETLPSLLLGFRAANPALEINLREMAPDALVRALHDRQLDVAFIYLPSEDAALDRMVVAREALVLALPAHHPLANRKLVDVSRLADESFVMPARHGIPGLHARVLALCRDGGFTPRAAQDDVWLIQTIVGLVAGGAGVALVPESVQALGRRGVVYRRVRGSGRHVVELAAVWRREDTSPVLSRFLEHVRAFADDA
jgi:DNA-binding transcriptional LysR family regulator